MSQINIRMDDNLKKQADELFNELGLNMSTAITMFIKQAVMQRRIPFEIASNRPDKETLSAMLEAERISKDPSIKVYDDLDELFAELKK